MKRLMNHKDTKRKKKEKTLGIYNAIKNLTYYGKNDGSRSHLLDIYSPVENYNGATIFNIHGGGYFQGDKDFSELYCSYFVSEGFKVVNLNYSLINNKENIDIRTQIFDLVMAINFIYDHRIEYKIDTDKLFLMGDSAGGHLAMMTAFTFKYEELQKYYNIPYVREINFLGIELSSTMYNFAELRKKSKRFLSTRGAKEIFSKCMDEEGFLEINSPKTYITQGYELPPLFILTSQNDYFKSETIELHLDLEKRDIKHVYWFEHSVSKNLGHIYNHFNLDTKEVKKANEAIKAFFLDKIKK